LGRSRNDEGQRGTSHGIQTEKEKKKHKKIKLKRL